jgi:hypothetical protein
MEEELSPEDIAAISSPSFTKEYEDMPLSEVGMRAVQNLPGSVWESAKGIANSVMHPIDTAKALGDVGYGFGSMAYGAMGGEQDPQAKADNERLARAVVEPYTSIANFKKELAENPAGPLSMILPAGGGALTKTGEVLNVAGKAAGIGRLGMLPKAAGIGLKAAAAAVDPARAIKESARLTGKFGPRAVTLAQHHSTGSPEAIFAKAFEAGADRSPDGPAIRERFNQFYKGEGDVVGLSQDFDKAVEMLRNRTSQDWIATRGTVTGAATAPIDFSGIQNAVMNSFANYGGHPLTATRAFPEARAALKDANKLVREYSRYTPGTGKNNLAGLDELKRALWDKAQSSSGAAANAYKEVHAAVKQTLEKVSPEYAKLMDEYQEFLDDMQSIRGATGAGSKMDANAQLAKAIASFRKPGRTAMLERVGEINPTLPYAVAGAALNQNPVGLRQVIAGSAAALPAIGAAISSGDPAAIAKLLPVIIGGLAVTSPRTMGKLNYGMGRAAAGLNAVGDIPLAPGVDVGSVVSGAAKAAYPAGLAVEQLQHANNRLLDDGSLPMADGSFLSIEEPDAMATGGRVARKSGGRIKSNKISAEVKRVRTLLSHKTASILSVPDDAVATALHIAKGQS